MRILDFISIVPWTLVIMIINVYILYRILKKFLFKPVTNMLNARSDEIRKTYEDARRDKIEAETSKKIYADKLLGAESERDKIISEATAAAKVTESQIIKKASSKAEKIISTASVNSEKIQKRALESAKDELSSLAIEIAQKIAQKEIDPESNEKLIEDFIDSLDVKPL